MSYQISLNHLQNTENAKGFISLDSTCPLTGQKIVDCLKSKPGYLLAAAIDRQQAYHFYDGIVLCSTVKSGANPLHNKHIEYIDFFFLGSKITRKLNKKLKNFATIEKTEDVFKLCIKNITLVKPSLQLALDPLLFAYNALKITKKLDEFAQEGHPAKMVAKSAYEYIKTIQEPSQMMYNYKQAADLGSQDASFELADYYYNVERNSEMGIEYLHKAARQKHVRAQSLLGSFYYEIKKDYTQAYQWTLKAAEQGEEEAQCKLGFFYDQAIGVKKDSVQAFYWTKKAATQGHAEAQKNVSTMYLTGLGIKKSAKKAFRWMEKAAKEGYAVAQFQLGNFYEEGIGVDRNLSKALEWTKYAADNGHALAKTKLPHLEEIINQNSATLPLLTDELFAIPLENLEEFDLGLNEGPSTYNPY